MEVVDEFVEDLMSVVAKTVEINTEDYDGYFEISLQIGFEAKNAVIYFRDTRTSE